MHGTQLDDLWLYQEQLSRWTKDSPTERQRTEVERLTDQLSALRQVLTLCHAKAVKKKRRKGRRRRLKGKVGRGTLEKERPPVFGMIQRGGQVVINMLDNVKQKTIKPFIKDTITLGTLVYTDEYSIYARLKI